MGTSSTCTVSVIIATKNRAAELRTISLPSLGQQNVNCFETIVWDASDDDSSKCVAEEFAATHPERIVRYFKAPRSGSSAQRNDAVREAEGDIVYFIDDDCEVSQDGISALLEIFKLDGPSAAALSITNKWPAEVIARSGPGFASAVRTVYTRLFAPSYKASGLIAVPRLRDSAGEMLSGGNMAIRRAILAEYGFDERFQRYAGYALWEDRALCQLLTSRGFSLQTAKKGQIDIGRPPGNECPSPFERDK